MCEVVVGIGHVDQALDEVGALDEAEEHLKTNTQIRDERCSSSASALCSCSRSNAHLSQPRDVQAFPVIDRGLAGFAGPRPFSLAVGEAGPGEDVVVGQVQVCGVHRELADELQQAGQAVQQPLQRKQGGSATHSLKQHLLSDDVHASLTSEN